MQPKYYFSIGKVKKGPFTIEELKHQSISDKHLIWNEGFKEWKIATQVEEIKDFLIRTPPLTPEEITSKMNVKTGKRVSIEWILNFPILSFASFDLAGGFASDEKIKKLYPSSGTNAIYANANDIRYEILIPLALGIGLTISLVIALIRYYYLSKKNLQVTSKVLDNKVD